ncbi:MAG: ATP-binding protein [Acidimicrobiales bacterium]
MEVAAASGATLVLPAVDHPAVTAWADRHGVMVELEGAQHLDDLTAYQAGAAPLVGDVCPYPGLAAYGAGDAGRFFGREALVAELLERATEPFVSVVGASGSGKSSLVRAGLLPSLAAGALPGSEEWPQIVLSPGSEPLAALAEALGTSQEGSVEQWCERAVESLLDGRHRASRVVLVIDQFEEMFTLAEPEAAAALIKAIVGLRHHRVLAVAIMRRLLRRGRLVRRSVRRSVRRQPAACRAHATERTASSDHRSGRTLRPRARASAGRRSVA